MPKFNNTENEKVQTADGREVWLSRSCAVTLCAMALDPGMGEPLVLITKRGPKCPDFVDHWCIVCGYIDRDETSGLAAKREGWEETGIDFDEAMKQYEVAYQDVNDDEEDNPWHCHTTPFGQKQNITLHHAIVLVTDDPPKPVFDPSKGEVADAKWVPVSEFTGGKYRTCFNHDKRVALFMWRVARHLQSS